MGRRAAGAFAGPDGGDLIALKDVTPQLFTEARSSLGMAYWFDR